jgi:hypothetical protein
MKNTVNWKKAPLVPLAATMWRGRGKTYMRKATEFGNRENYVQMADNEVISFAGGAPDGSDSPPAGWWITVVREGESVTCTVRVSTKRGKVATTRRGKVVFTQTLPVK